MKIRLVAYRLATTSATTYSTYQLDLQEEPNISLNFQFSDIKEPETRKASYSQTFKLPFTDTNNTFFEQWYNVNASTLVYTTKEKFNAVLYVGTVPQFEGFLQLKRVYQKAQYYEVVLMSNTSDLFSVIGEKKLQDVFKNDNGTYSTELNHTYNETQLVNSWNGSSSAFVNAAGTALRDTDVNVQKVMYPMSVTQPEFYFESGSSKFLDMSQADINNTSIYPSGAVDAQAYMVSLLQFRPAIQIKTLFQLIFARAGFRYTSSFIDGAYFGKIFMTTGNDLGASTLPTTSSSTDFSGSASAYNVGNFGSFTGPFPFDCQDTPATIIKAGTTDFDPQNAWNTTGHYFTKTHPTQLSMNVQHRVYAKNLESCEDADAVLDIWLEGFNTTTNTDTGDIWGLQENLAVTMPTIQNIPETTNFYHTLDLTNIPLDQPVRIKVRVKNIKQSFASPQITIGYNGGFGPSGIDESFISVSWADYSLGIYGSTINVPMCIDDSITQKAFLKDIIQRFNLIILSDPEDATNLIIEPYNDYLATSTIKDWTHKLDTSKEVIVKDTTSLQKKTIKFTDLEDDDLHNKSFKQDYPKVNVYGHYDGEITQNEFAKGELKNEAIFSPYINDRVFPSEDQWNPSEVANMTVQYEFSYNEEEIATTDSTTKPKLFWYNGSPTTVLSQSGNTVTYYMHRQPVSGLAINAYSFTTYPVCSPFDITPSSNEYTLSPTNKSLYWNANPPLSASTITVFNYTGFFGTWFDNALYGLYWQSYLNNIYSDEARIMEAYINLNEVDIFDFKFNDEIFIKDTYWRVLTISNYQVGGEVSTKVTLIKVIDSINNCPGCDYVIGYNSEGGNLQGGIYYLWCPEGEPGCSPQTTAPFLGIYTHPECCYCMGGTPWLFVTAYEAQGIFPCEANDGSLPISQQNTAALNSFLGSGTLKNAVYKTIAGKNLPLTTGMDTTKYSRGILPYYGDDVVIKYKNKRNSTPQIKGESHRLVLTGNTEGNTRGYAYPEGTLNSKPLKIPGNTNMIIRVKGIATVIGGTSSTYPVGTTEAFAYYTAFKNTVDGITQLGTVGGDGEFALREGANPTTCTLYIDINNGILRFGLDDSQTDTRRVWSLSVDLDINSIFNMNFSYDANWALFQNGDYILFQDTQFLIWN